MKLNLKQTKNTFTWKKTILNNCTSYKTKKEFRKKELTFTLHLSIIFWPGDKKITPRWELNYSMPSVNIHECWIENSKANLYTIEQAIEYLTNWMFEDIEKRMNIFHILKSEYNKKDSIFKETK